MKAAKTTKKIVEMKNLKPVEKKELLERSKGVFLLTTTITIILFNRVYSVNTVH